MGMSVGVSGLALAGCIEPGETVDNLPRPVMGNEDASVEIHVFEDFSCGACQDFVLNHLPNIKEEYIDEGLVTYYHYDWPIPVHPRWSSEMANGARAVQDKEGDELFFEYKKLLFENQSNISVDVMRDLAEEIGVEDVDYVLESASNSMYQPVIDSDVQEGNDRGVEGTPTVFIGGDSFDDLEALPDYQYETIASTIEAQL